jgi:hypothetical protein
MSWSVCPLLGRWETTLKAFCLSALWQIYETLSLLLRVQDWRFITPSQSAGLIVLSMGDGILTHLLFRFPDPANRFQAIQKGQESCHCLTVHTIQTGEFSSQL